MQFRQAKKVLKDTVSVKHSKIQGWGLFARKAIPKNDMIVE
jgi:SET domain-containing protein